MKTCPNCGSTNLVQCTHCVPPIASCQTCGWRGPASSLKETDSLKEAKT